MQKNKTPRSRWKPRRAAACVAAVAAILLLAAPLSIAVSSLDGTAPVSADLSSEVLAPEGAEGIPSGAVLEDDDLPSLPVTDEERQAVLEGYLADGTLTEEDLSNDFIVESLTGSYLDNDPAAGGSGMPDSQHPEELCGNCRDEYEEGIREVEQREQERAAWDEEVQTQLDAEPVPSPSEDDDDGSDIDPAVVDPSLSGNDLVDRQPYIPEGAATGYQVSRVSSEHTYAPAAYTLGETDTAGRSGQVPEIVLKDVKSVDVLGADGQITQSLWIGRPDRPEWPPLDTVNQLAYVQMYRAPAFYAKIISGHGTEDGQYLLTIQLPQSKGEEPRYVDVVYATSGYTSNSTTVYPPIRRPAVNDATVIAALAKVSGYNAARDNAYLNAYKLAPFASYEAIVEAGNAMAADSALATKEIRELWPVHRDQGMKVSLLEGEEADIVRAMVYFTDGTFQSFELDYLGTRSLAASYTIEGSGLLYQPDFWVLGEGASHGIERIAAFIRSKTWNDFFGKLNTDSRAKIHRTVRDYFDNDIHDRAEEVAANLVSNIDSWSATATDVLGWNSLMEIAETAQPSTDWSEDPELKMFNLLFLYTYFERFLDFNTGGNPQDGFQNNANAFLVTAFRGGVFKSGCSLVNMTYMVRSSGMYTFAAVDKVSSTVISGKLSAFTGIYNSPTMVETLVKRTSGYTDTADWFADYMDTIAFYHEYKPPELEGVSDDNRLVWRGWDQAKRYPDSLLLWLTMEPGAQYFASTSMLLATGSTGIYDAKTVMDDAHRLSYKTRLDNIFLPAARYATSTASIVGSDKVNKVCIITCDQRTSKVDTGKSETVWLESQAFWGKKLTQDPYHKNYTDVTGYYMTSGQGAAAMAINSSLTVKRIYFLAYTSLGCSFSYYWSHEIAHTIDNDIFIGGDRRGINNTEDYTDGFLTQSHGQLSYTMNLTFDYSLSSDILTNATRERIYGKENVDDYFHKLYETMDVIDYAALQAFLRLDKDEQNAVASQAWFSGQNGTSALDTGATAVNLYSRNHILSGYDGTAATAPVNSSVFNDGTKKFETIEEVYDNQVFLRPGISDSSSLTWLWANYVSEDLRGVWWFPVHCNGNRPDSRSFKLQAYRFMGSDGYDAWAEFSRNGGGGDLAKLQKITGYDSYKEWWMAKWAAIEASKNNLAFIGFNDLVDKFEAALKEDAGKNDRNLLQMHSLRTRMLYMMKRMTNDFRTDIYSVPQITHIRTLNDLRAIADDPYGYYILDNDIKVSPKDFEESKALIDTVFYGKLDGNGHRIYCDDEILPNLFAGVKHAYVKNITLGGVASYVISSSIVNSELENINFEKFERHIYDVDDLVGMANDLRLGIDAFHLMADLDLSAWSDQNEAAATPATAVVTQLMAGTQEKMKVFNGNGHRITGLRGASLFDRICFADINNLNISDSQNIRDAANGTYAALVVKRAYRSQFSDIFFKDVSLQARAFVGFVCGDDGFVNAAGKDVRDGGSRFQRIQVVDGSVIVGGPSSSNVFYGGFISGRICYSSMEDIYAQGSMVSYGTCCGGLTGALTKSANLNRCISNVSVDRKKSGNNGVLLGDIETAAYDADNTRISNCLGLGNPAPVSENALSGRLAMLTDAALTGGAFVQCFENVTHRYGLTLMGNEAADIGFVRTECYTLARDGEGKNILSNYETSLLRENDAFYKSLGFSEDVWDFYPTMQVGNPVLRFEGDEETFFDYDISFTLDFENECLRISGSDYVPASTRLHNFPYKVLVDKPGWPAGTWIASAIQDFPVPVSTASLDSNRIDLSETIEYEGFSTAEVQRKGTRTITMIQAASALGKKYSFEKTVEIPPRPVMAYADRIRGIRADSKGNGAIHFASQATVADTLEYRPAGDDAQDADWTPITAAMTTVPAGDYEVRIASTKNSFASYPVTVTVDEFDPDTVIFPLVLEPNGGTWVEGYQPPDEYNNEQSLSLPAPDRLQRGGYTFGGWYASRDFSGAAVTEIPAGRTEPQTLYAQWHPNTYKVSLHLEGGQLPSSSSNVTQYVAGTGAQLPTPTRDYRSFGGWFDNPQCQGEPVSAIWPSDFGDKEFWAKWDTINYNVTLYLQDGELAEGLTDTFTYEAGMGTVLPRADQISLIGHSFKGWYDNRGYTGNPVEVIAATATGPKEFWAKWETDIYAVTLAMNQGKLIVGEHDVVSYQYGMETILPQLERNGYQFGGWYTDAECTEGPVTSIPVGEIGDKRFWAKWVPLDYSIVYDLGTDEAGNRPPAIDLDAYDSYTVGNNLHLPGASVMVWEGHTFAGWYESSDFSGSPITEITADRYGDIALFARWIGDGCFFSYYLNGGAFEGEQKVMFEFSEGGFQSGQEVELPDASSLSREGYSFGGWYGDAGFTGSALQEVQLVQGVVPLYAKWDPVQYRIDYDLNGGTWVDGYNPPQTYTVESGDIWLPIGDNLQRSGWVFERWCGAATLKGDTVSLIPSGSTGDRMLYAGWKEEASELPPLQISGISLEGFGPCAVEWDDTGYAKIQCPRSKMPSKAEDIKISVPQGIYVHSITKRSVSPVQFFARLLRIEAESDVWDIVLKRTSDPSFEKLYTLEIVPTDESSSGGDDNSSGSTDKPTTNPSDKPSDKPSNSGSASKPSGGSQGTAGGSSNSGSNGGSTQGSGHGSSNGSGGGSVEGGGAVPGNPPVDGGGGSVDGGILTSIDGEPQDSGESGDDNPEVAEDDGSESSSGRVVAKRYNGTSDSGEDGKSEGSIPLWLPIGGAVAALLAAAAWIIAVVYRRRRDAEDAEQSEQSEDRRS